MGCQYGYSISFWKLLFNNWACHQVQVTKTKKWYAFHYSYYIVQFFTDDTKSAFQQTSQYDYESLRNKQISSHEVVDQMLQMDGEIYKVSETF